jgi:hypothetical protein
MRFHSTSIHALAILALLAGCSARPSAARKAGRVTNYTNCQIRSDQGTGSFQGSWAGLPIPLVLDRDFYMTDEGEAVTPLRNAAETWNAWARLRGMQAFRITSDVSGASGGRDIPEISSCVQAAYSSSVTDVVGIWKIATHGFHKNQRDSCPRTADGKMGRILYYDDATGAGVQGQTDWVMQSGRITGASILLNFEGYNAPGRQRIDVESLLLHELGHVLGLLHSCNGSTGDAIDGTSSPACGVAPDAYTEAVAVMFPYLEVAQERRDLKQNDFDRINCIY